MNRFTIMPEFIDGCKDSCYYFEVLSYFPMKTNPFKVCMDNLGLAYNEYEKIAKHNAQIFFWIRLLNDNANSIYKVNLRNRHYDSVKELFLEITNNVQPSKQLITSDKAIFNENLHYVQENQIRLLEPDEASYILSATKTIQISYGDNSPIICGNNNIIK